VSDRRVFAAGGAAAAIVTVLVIGTGLGWWNGGPSAGAPAKPLSVRTSLTPRPAFFGDAVTAEVDVTADARMVPATSIHVLPTFDPFVESGAPTVTTSRIGDRLLVRYRYRVQCSTDACVPIRKPLSVELAPVLVTARAGRQPLQATARWPKTSVLSRLQPGDVGASAHFRAPRDLPAPTYASWAGGLADVFTALGAALAVAAFALLGYELVRLLEHRRLRRLVRLTPLEAAVAYARESASRPDASDRRKALSQLAEVLEREGIEPLAETAGDVAWSEREPTPDRTLELAEQVESSRRDGA